MRDGLKLHSELYYHIIVLSFAKPDPVPYPKGNFQVHHNFSIQAVPSSLAYDHVYHVSEHVDDHNGLLVFYNSPYLFQLSEQLTPILNDHYTFSVYDYKQLLLKY